MGLFCFVYLMEGHTKAGWGFNEFLSSEYLLLTDSIPKSKDLIKDLIMDITMCKNDSGLSGNEFKSYMIPNVIGGFRTILADPPWRFTNRTGKVAPEHHRLERYSTMSLDEIKSLDVKGVSAPSAHLYLWVPNALLPEGLEVLTAWGFRYVSNIVWAKRRKDGGPDGRGVGFYFRNVTELILFGVRGSMRTLAPARSQVNMIETRKREHSRKPDEQYNLIESCSPGPYLELFARYPRNGWMVWGDESAEMQTPKGRVHKGYAGGAITPDLLPNVHIDKNIANALGQELRKRYENGDSIRQLAAETGYSIQRVRTVLTASGVVMRSRGRNPGISKAT